MAVTSFTSVKAPGPIGSALVVTWPTVPVGNTGSPVENPAHSDRSVQVTGTFGGSTVTIEGSNDGSNWSTLTDTAAGALTFTSAGLRQILQVTRYIRPSVAAGSGTPTITLLIVSK